MVKFENTLLDASNKFPGFSSSLSPILNVMTLRLEADMLPIRAISDATRQLRYVTIGAY